MKYPISTLSKALDVKQFFRASEWYFLSVLSLYTVLALLFFSEIPIVKTILLENILIAIGLISLAALSTYKAESFFSFLHTFYHLPLIYLFFIQVFSFISVLNPKDYDHMLIAWDFSLLGVNPTVWLQQYSHPILTEFLQIAYVLFFFHAFTQTIEHYKKGRIEDADFVTRTIVFGFLLSYLAYFFLPAIGPRFTLHDYSLLNAELPGIWLTEHLRTIIDSGDGVRLADVNPMSQVHRNCMPSGHTMMTLMNMIIAFKLRSSLRWIFFFMGISLIFATIYLRYHYVVDVLFGIVFAFLALWLEPICYRFLLRYHLIKK